MAIIKILSRHNPTYRSLLRYILNESKNEKPQIFTHNIRTNNIEGYIKEFIQNESLRKNNRSDQVYLYHEIISFNASENKAKITPEMLNDIAQYYFKNRGEGVSVGAVHRKGNEHIHIHFCTSALQYRTGKSMRISKPELHKLKVSLQEYHKQKYPEISNSFPNHGSGKPYQKNYSFQKEKRNSIKEKISDIIKSCFEKAGSQKEFLQSLMGQNIFHYERNGKITGVEYEDMKFRFSSLGIDNEQLEALPKDLSEEKKVLKQIQKIRQNMDSNITQIEKREAEIDRN